jgi:MFS family permease
MTSLSLLLLLLADLVDEWMGWFPVGLLPDVRGHFAVGYGKASLVLTAHLVGGYVGSMFGGVLADIWDRRRLLLGGAALYALGLGLAGMATSFGAVLVACACIGLSSGPLVHTAQVILVDRARARGERLERMLGRFNALGSVGDLLGPASLTLGLGVGLGWRWLLRRGRGRHRGLRPGARRHGPPALAHARPRPG